MDDKLVRAKVHTVVQQHCHASGVQPNPYLAQRVLAAAHEGGKGTVKSKKPLIILIVLAMIFLSTTVALAWSLSREYFADIAQSTLTSGDYENWLIEEKRYMMTVMGKYGLVFQNESNDVDVYETPGEEAISPEEAERLAEEHLISQGCAGEEVEGVWRVWHYMTHASDVNREDMVYCVHFRFADRSERCVFLRPDGTLG